MKFRRLQHEAFSDDNPFRVHGIVHDQFFTDRVDELGKIRRVLREPGAKLLLVDVANRIVDGAVRAL